MERGDMRRHRFHEIAPATVEGKLSCQAKMRNVVEPFRGSVRQFAAPGERL
jgi:hypothetical protein